MKEFFRAFMKSSVLFRQNTKSVRKEATEKQLRRKMAN